jgi:hypothetical protein
LPTLGFAFLQNTVAGKTKAYGKLGFWELLLSFKAQVGPVYVLTCVDNMLILKLCLSVLLYTIKTSYLWLFQVDDNEGDDDEIYLFIIIIAFLSPHHHSHPPLYIKEFYLDSQSFHHKGRLAVKFVRRILCKLFHSQL